jgi:hypothetical protein
MSTPNGLPYPESTDDLNQGANDIKALALALDPRAGYIVEAGGGQFAVSGGNCSINFKKAFPRPPWVVVSATYLAGNPIYIPLIGMVNVTASGFSMFIVGVASSATPTGSQPWGGPTTIHYVAVSAP